MARLGRKTRGETPQGDVLEEQLVAIWSRAFDGRPIGVNDDFFAIGGKSMQAFKIFTDIAETLDHDLPPSTLLEAPTIAQLAKLLRENDGQSAATLVAIRRDGTKAPFYCVHGRGGNVLFLQKILSHFDEQRPVYGFQAAGLNENAPRYDRVEAMAAHHVDEMRAAQPEGPYHLGGYSFGGLVALEMAHQLSAAGQHVGLLVMIDTYLLDGSDRPMAPGENGGGRRRTAGRYVKGVQATRARQARQRKAAKLVAAGRPLTGELRAWYFGTVHLQAARHYSPRPYHGRMAMIVAADNADRHERAWSKMADQFEMRTIPVSHGDLIREPYVADLGAHLTELLDDADAAAPR